MITWRTSLILTMYLGLYIIIQVDHYDDHTISLILCVSTAQRSHEVHCGPGDSLMDRNLVTQDLAPIPWSLALWKWNMYPEGLGEVHFCKEKGRIMQIKV